MVRIWIIIVIGLIFFTTLPQDLFARNGGRGPLQLTGPSQLRREFESFEEAEARYLEWLKAQGLEVDPFAQTARRVAVPLERVDFSEIPSWDALGENDEVVQLAFETSRDERYLVLPERPSFLRRPSWLYPDDGCFARSALTAKKLQSWNYPRPFKLFAFGNLRVNTKNHPAGKVFWWYHVVPIISYRGQVYVLDAAIEPTHPLFYLEWVDRMIANRNKIKLSVCNPYAYEPNSLCYQAGPNSEKSAYSHQIYYLRREWQRILNLRRNPEDELGDAPPWILKTGNFGFDRLLLPE